VTWADLTNPKSNYLNAKSGPNHDLVLRYEGRMNPTSGVRRASTNSTWRRWYDVRHMDETGRRVFEAASFGRILVKAWQSRACCLRSRLVCLRSLIS